MFFEFKNAASDVFSKYYFDDNLKQNNFSLLPLSSKTKMQFGYADTSDTYTVEFTGTNLHADSAGNFSSGMISGISFISARLGTVASITDFNWNVAEFLQAVTEVERLNTFGSFISLFSSGPITMTALESAQALLMDDSPIFSSSFSNNMNITGSLFQDHLVGSSIHDVMSGEDGDDTLLSGGGDDIVFGGLGNDTIFGGYGADLLEGNAGNDKIFGGKGNDTMFGSAGKDKLVGGKGNDKISGEAGNDFLVGMDGADILRGGNGRDTLHGGANADKLMGGKGNDVLIGGVGNDKMHGGAGKDVLKGMKGADTLNGNGGADILKGDNGRDKLYGGANADKLMGGKGGDFLDGGAGNDKLTGGAGNDVFVFQNGGGSDRVTDFSLGNDTLSLNSDLWGGKAMTAQQVVTEFANIVQSNAVFEFDTGDKITLVGISSTTGLESDISFI